MLLPGVLDYADGSENWRGFALATFISLAAGLGLVLVTRGADSGGLSRRQAFLLTTLVWVALPLFGALPFIFGAPHVSFTDAYFEAMSGLTTTGATVFTGLDQAPRGMLLWRALMQWYGGVGILVVAIVFLPALRIGGMQFFRSEAFDLSGDILPRATEIAASLSWIYTGLTALCALAYSAAGMNGFDALTHAMTTLATGGLANYDNSFAHFDKAAHYVGAIFMLAAGIPFMRYIQLTRGRARPLLTDPQVRAYLGIAFTAATALIIWLMLKDERPFDEAFISALFNVASVMTGTGYSGEDYGAWGGFAVAIFFMLGLIGGCTGSTACSAKVFRYQVLYAALVIQIKRIHSPHAVNPLRYANRPVEPEVVSSIIGYFFAFVGALVIFPVLLSLMGLDTLTAISGAAATLTNVGPGLGPVVGPAGSYQSLPDAAKWLLSLAMLLGRLEFLSVLVLLTPTFWAR